MESGKIHSQPALPWQQPRAWVTPLVKSSSEWPWIWGSGCTSVAPAPPGVGSSPCGDSGLVGRAMGPPKGKPDGTVEGSNRIASNTPKELWQEGS